MSELFEMLKQISCRRSVSGREGPPRSGKPAAPPQQLPPARPSDYEAHHGLVERLERFNGAIEPVSSARLKELRALEQEGLPLQAKLIDQYLRNQETLKLARQALWRECYLFWTQLAMAYVNLLRQVAKGTVRESSRSWLPLLVLKSIRYTALTIRWGYHQGQVPTLFSWRRMNKLYRLAERAGVADREMEEFAVRTTCAREYSMALLFDLAQPLGFKPMEIELAGAILEGLPGLPVPSPRLLERHHTHGVDLSSGQGAFNLDQSWVPGKRLRYLDFGQIHHQIEQAAFSLATKEAQSFCRHLASMIGRGGVRRHHPRTDGKGCYWVATGMDAIRTILDPRQAVGRKPLLEPWLTRDQSQQGVGFVVADGEPVSTGQFLLVSAQPEEHDWQLMVVRWHNWERGKQLVGAQCLSRHPKGVAYQLPDQSDHPHGFMVFMPMLDAASGVSNVLLPKSDFKRGIEIKLQDSRLNYHLQLTRAVEEHGDWVRSGFEVLACESIEQVA